MAGGFEDITVITDLAIVMMASAVAAIALHRLRQPVVLGYILAGFLVGPFSPLQGLTAPIGVTGDVRLPFLVHNAAFVESIRDLGLILLLFAIGLEFNVGKLKKIGSVAVVSAVLQMALMFGFGFLIAEFLSWRFIDALFLGAVLAISSTALILKLLMEARQLNEEHAKTIVGILLVEDVVAILMIALLPSIALSGDFNVEALGILVLQTTVFIVAALVLGLVFIPRLVDYVSRLRVDEIAVVTVLALAFAMSVFAASLGFSLALGAFIVGALVGDSHHGHSLGERVAPVRDMFTAIFFVAVGMLIDPRLLADHWVPVLIISAIAIVGKFVAAAFSTFVAGLEVRQAFRVGLGLAMIGEFSIILVTVGASLPEPFATSDFLFPVVVSVVAVSSFVTPNLIRRSDSLMAFTARVTPRALHTYAHVYREWVARLRTGESSAEVARSRQLALHAIVYAVLVVALLALASLVAGEVEQYTSESGLAVLAVWTVTAFLILPIFIALVNEVRGLINALVDLAVPDRIRESRPVAGAARVIRRTFWLAGTVVLSSVVFAAGAPFLPSWQLLLTAAVIVAVASVFLFRAVRDLHEDVESAVRRVFTDEDAAQPATYLDALKEQAPAALVLEEVDIDGHATAAHRTLRDLNLRETTGVSVLAIHRGGARLVNPDPFERILPGDVLVVMGEQPEIDAARTLLTVRAPAPSPRKAAGLKVDLEEFVMASTSPFAGHTLVEANVRNVTGASIVAIRRGGVRVVNPRPEERLLAGDTVLLLGDVAQRDAAKRHLAPRAEEASPE